MSIQIYNSLTRKKEIFKPLQDRKVSMYVCGPTVYSDCHVGHIMGPVIFDTIARWFILSDYEVEFVNNITDIDDKIINKSLELSCNWQEITTKYTKQYFSLLDKLNITTITKSPLCSAYIQDMIDFIDELMAKNIAYVSSDGVYFDITSYDNYGELSNRNLQDMLEGVRKEVQSNLRQSCDFCLWKFAKENEPSWDSPWGAGRPGWHIECSVMATCLLGKEFDIHGGGDDLKFPHHENEIAQSKAHHGSYASYWMHNGLIQYENKKISKSDPRMQDEEFKKHFQASFLLEKYSAEVLRFFLLSGHYRRPFDFSPSRIEQAEKSFIKLASFVQEKSPNRPEDISLEALQEKIPSNIKDYIDTFIKAMNDDFNTSQALAQVHQLLPLAKKDDKIVDVVYHLLSFLGIDCYKYSKADNKGDEIVASLMDLIIHLRSKFRENKDYQTSDEIRDHLQKVNIQIQDTKETSLWKYL